MTVAIGFFDGVHLGHQAILSEADIALTFKNHPISFLAPERAPRLIMNWQERERAIRKLGVEVAAFEFNAEIANLTPADFLKQLEVYADEWARRLRLPKGNLRIRAGANWRFGKGGTGDAAFARAHGCEVEEVPYVDYGDAPISSTRIRLALEQGEVELANAMLGRRLKIEGKIVKGKGAGTHLGFPTINIKEDARDKVSLPNGVYEVDFHGMKAVANHGFAPTFAEQAWTEPIWEVHIVGAKVESADEGEVESFEVVRFLRPERKFESIEDLQRQIALDCGIIST